MFREVAIRGKTERRDRLCREQKEKKVGSARDERRHTRRENAGSASQRKS